MQDRYAIYEGCSLHSTAKEYNESTRAVFSHLGIKLDAVKRWTCCGTSSKISPDSLVSIAMPFRNLVQAEKDGQKEVLVPCAACFYRLKDALHSFREKKEIEEKLNRAMEYTYKDSVRVVHPLEILSQKEALALISQKVKRRLTGIKAVAYYGCLITRPPKVMEIPDYEYPMSMDRIMKKIGIEVLDWSYKTECCGASYSLTRTDIVLKLCEKILKEAKDRGADVIVTACPLCQGNLDMRQQEVSKASGIAFNIPVVYFTQLMGLAFGIDADELSLGSHVVDTEALRQKIQKIPQLQPAGK